MPQRRWSEPVTLRGSSSARVRGPGEAARAARGAALSREEGVRGGWSRGPSRWAAVTAVVWGPPRSRGVAGCASASAADEAPHLLAAHPRRCLLARPRGWPLGVSPTPATRPLSCFLATAFRSPGGVSAAIPHPGLPAASRPSQDPSRGRASDGRPSPRRPRGRRRPRPQGTAGLGQRSVLLRPVPRPVGGREVRQRP